MVLSPPLEMRCAAVQQLCRERGRDGAVFRGNHGARARIRRRSRRRLGALRGESANIDSLSFLVFKNIRVSNSNTKSNQWRVFRPILPPRFLCVEVDTTFFQYLAAPPPIFSLYTDLNFRIWRK